MLRADIFRTVINRPQLAYLLKSRTTLLISRDRKIRRYFPTTDELMTIPIFVFYNSMLLLFFFLYDSDCPINMKILNKKHMNMYTIYVIFFINLLKTFKKKY